MELGIDFLDYTKWSAMATIACLLLSLIGFIAKWGIRFRLVGVTGFMAVLTGGLFALSLGLFTRQVVPGAVRFVLVYDNGANQAVISVKPEVTPTEIEATLRQAANDLYSSGRNGLNGDNNLTIRVRTLLHPQPGVTLPIYLGEVKKALGNRDSGLDIKVFTGAFAQLPTVKSD